VTLTIPQMIARNNRAVRRARLLRRLRWLWVALIGASISLLAAAILTRAAALAISASLAAPTFPGA